MIILNMLRPWAGRASLPLHGEMTCELLRALTQAKFASAKMETQPMVIYFYEHIKIGALKRWVRLMTEEVL